VRIDGSESNVWPYTSRHRSVEGRTLVITVVVKGDAERVRLDILTAPADADPYALRLARRLAAWLAAAGIDARVTPTAEEELLRRALVNAEFDLFVARLPDRFRSPDALYSLLHSQYAETPGWQNPFGYANLAVDDLLESQRLHRGSDRREVVAELQRTVARTQPFTLLAFPDDVRAARDDHYRNWSTTDLRSPRGYLTLERADRAESVEDGASRRPSELVAVSTDRRVTENLNPLAVEFRRTGALTGLIYDSLGYVSDAGDATRWLASSWAFSRDGAGIRARVTVRPDLRWHDGEPLTADDVAFTYTLFADTSLGRTGEDGPVPAPRFQGRSRLVDDVRAVDERTVEFRFADCTPAIATRAFTVPILPEHVWRERSDPASVAGIEVGTATDALVTNNVPPVGSGPLRFVANTPGERLVLERFDGHFLARERVSGASTPLAGGPAFDHLLVRVVGSDAPAVEMIADGEADVTATPVGADAAPRIARDDDLGLHVKRSESPYVLGYNARRTPLSNSRFRSTLAHLFDRSHLAEEVFEGYARPAVSLLAGTDWLPGDLRWNDHDPVTPFLGSDGELAVDRVRAAFRDAGYRYENGHLVEATG
jgi:peptide/nickel transport system substrate-binding protein